VFKNHECLPRRKSHGPEEAHSSQKGKPKFGQGPQTNEIENENLLPKTL